MLAYILFVAVTLYFGLFRNFGVYCFRMRLLEQIDRAVLDDIARGFSFENRFQAFGAVSYPAMVLQFWKPLRVSSFYQDSCFLEKHPKGDSVPLNPPSCEACVKCMEKGKADVTFNVFCPCRRTPKEE